MLNEVAAEVVVVDLAEEEVVAVDEEAVEEEEVSEVAVEVATLLLKAHLNKFRNLQLYRIHVVINSFSKHLIKLK